MTVNVFHLDAAESVEDWSELLSEAERETLAKTKDDPTSTGYMLIDEEGDILVSHNVAEIAAPVFANVFDICEQLREELSQSEHRSVTFESRDTMITCHRFSATQLVVYRSAASKR